MSAAPSAAYCGCGHLTAIHLYPFGCASCECALYGLAAQLPSLVPGDWYVSLKTTRRATRTAHRALDASGNASCRFVLTVSLSRPAVEGDIRCYSCHTGRRPVKGTPR